MSQFLSKIVGQKKTISILEKFCETIKFPHALLFTGKKGVGKFFAAIQFAKEINSEIITSQFIKNKFNLLEEPYIKYIFPLSSARLETLLFESESKLSKDDKNLWSSFQNDIQSKIANPYYHPEIKSTSSIRISQIRNISKYLTLDYPEIPFRTIIIEDADLMTEQSQNALLKNLEEPPKGVIFILITSNSQKLLSTIRSRCQEIKFEGLQNSQISKILKEYFTIDSQIENGILDIANGSVSEANDMLDFKIDETKDLVINILRHSLAGHFKSSFLFYSEAIADRRKLMIVNSLIIVFFIDCRKLQLGSEKGLFFSDYKQSLENFNSNFPKVDLKNLNEKLVLFNSMLEKNINLTLLILDIIFEIRQLGKK